MEKEWRESILPQIWQMVGETCRKNAPFVKNLPGAYEIYGADIGRLLVWKKIYNIINLYYN